MTAPINLAVSPPPAGSVREAGEKARPTDTSASPLEAQKAPATGAATRTVLLTDGIDQSIRDAAARVRKQLEEAEKSGYLRPLRIEYSVEGERGLVVIKLKDARTDKVIRSIPPEEQIEFSRKMEEFLGLLFDEKG